MAKIMEKKADKNARGWVRKKRRKNMLRHERHADRVVGHWPCQVLLLRYLGHKGAVWGYEPLTVVA